MMKPMQVIWSYARNEQENSVIMLAQANSTDAELYIVNELLRLFMIAQKVKGKPVSQGRMKKRGQMTLEVSAEVAFATKFQMYAFIRMMKAYLRQKQS